jgi:hypothetical protein
MHFSASGFASLRRMQDFADAASTDFWSICKDGEKRTL